MLVKIYATKSDGYWWKAPSWSDGRGFAMESGIEVDLDAADMEALEAHVKAGYWLRYEPVADKVETVEKVEKVEKAEKVEKLESKKAK